MHRRPQTAGLGAVMLGLFVAVLFPAAVAAREPFGRPSPGRPWTRDAVELAQTAPEAILAGTTHQSCTGWRSTLAPPPTINVLRTKGPNAGHVDAGVPLYDYVRTVLVAEWPSYWPIEASKVGAIAVKQYAWYYTIVYRGGKDADGVCYDVQDNTNDQWYEPETRNPTVKQKRAVDATWDISLRKFQAKTGKSHMFLTGYRSGTSKVCGVDADGFHLYQHSVLRCALSPPDGLGWTYEQILRRYFTHLEFVQRGHHDIIGTVNGDASVLRSLDASTVAPRIYTISKAAMRLAGEPSEPTLDSNGLLGAISVDLDHDGHDDLLTLKSTGERALSIDAAMSDGTSGYGALSTWWSGDVGSPTDGAQLVAGDFSGVAAGGVDAEPDQFPDAGVLLQGDDPATTELLTFTNRTKGAAFADPVTRWSGPLDITTARAWAADVNGDGRADLLIRQDLGADGLRYSTASSSTPVGSLGELKPRLDATDLKADKVLEVVADADRDGRDDLWVIYPADGGTNVDLLRSYRSGFARSLRWSAPSSDPLPFKELKAAPGDVNGDGMGDLVLFRDLGAGSGWILTLTATYVGMKTGVTLDDDIDWSAAQPY